MTESEIDVRALPPRIALATTNRGKLAEATAILLQRGVAVIAADTLVPGWRAVEDGANFEENARIKARDLAERSGVPALGEDSGLEVAALGGRPGVRSARYAGEGTSDAVKITRLLEELQGVAGCERAAAFRCAVALAWPDGKIAVAEGRCEGLIAFAPRGAGGFGYDPIFVDPATGFTFAELPAEAKNALSHRRRALDALCAALAGGVRP